MFTGNGAVIVNPPASGTIISLDAVEQAADISTTSNVLADMGIMTRQVTLTDGQSIAFWFEATTFVANTADFMKFAVLINGVIFKQRAIAIGDLGAACIKMHGKTGALPAGVYTVKIQWANASNVNVLNCRPVASGNEGANLMVGAVTR